MTGIVYALVQIIEVVLNLAQFLIFLSVLISWFSADPRNPLVNIVRSMTEPIYQPIRKYVTNKISLPIDLAPLLAWLAIIFFQKLIQFQMMTSIR